MKKTLFKDEELVVSMLPFKHPPGFEPRLSFMVVVDDKARTFTNFPESMALSLSLLQAALQTLIERAPQEKTPQESAKPVPLFAVDGPQGAA